MNNYPYNPYGYNPQQYQEEYRRIQQNSREKREFRRRCTCVAFGIVLFIVLNYAVSMAILWPSQKLIDLYFGSMTFSLSIDVIITVISLFGAYLIMRLIIDRKHQAFIPLGAPENKKHAVLLIPVGILACIAGSYMTYYMNRVLENVFGVTFTQPEIGDPSNLSELTLFLLCSVLVPCIFEEVALRAGALEAFRKYGDRFAIIASAFIFAILHGNMVQMPFAFIAGLAIGYIYVVTGSIWPGVIIHFINNLTSCSTEIGNVFGVGTQAVDTFYIIYMGVFIIAGTVCAIIFLFDKKRPILNKDTSTLTFSQKFTGFVFNVPMILSMIYLAYSTSQYIE